MVGRLAASLEDRGYPAVVAVPDYKPELAAPAMQSLTIPMLKKGTALFANPAKTAPKDPGRYLASVHDLLPEQHHRLGGQVLRR